MKWFLKVLFYNYYHFYDCNLFRLLRAPLGGDQTKIVHEGATDLITLCFSFNLINSILFLSCVSTGDLIPKYWAFAAVCIIGFVGKMIFYYPVLGKDRWKEVLEDSQYGTRHCKIIATVYALLSLFGPIAAMIFYIKVVNP